MPIQKLYTIFEVAELTGLTLGTVRQYVSYGKIPALRLGSRRMITAEVLEKICSEGLRFDKPKTVLEKPKVELGGDPFQLMT